MPRNKRIESATVVEEPVLVEDTNMWLENKLVYTSDTKRITIASDEPVKNGLSLFRYYENHEDGGYDFYTEHGTGYITVETL